MFLYTYVSQHLFWMRAYRREADTLLANAHGVVDPEAAARRLRVHLVQQYTAGLMTAKCLVGLVWFITQAGGRGVEDLSLTLPACIEMRLGSVSNLLGCS